MTPTIREFIVAALLMCCVPPEARAQATDIIRGRVLDSQSQPLEGVHVRVTSAQGQVSKSATTDKGGRFTIVYINGEGDYWIELTRLGFAQKRYEVRKVGEEEVIIADARMSSTIAALDTVNTVGERNRLLPNRSASTPDVGGGDRALTGSPLSPDQAGNLAAMAAGIAGFQLLPGLDGAPDMYSVLGLGGDQNNVTFNGLGSGINTLPPDVLATTSINAYPFDVSKGGFSGAQITVQTIPGSNVSRRAITTANIPSLLESADAAGAQQTDKYTSLRLGGNAAGPIRFNEIFYSGAYNVGRRFNDTRTLLSTGNAGLLAAGIAPDSVAQLTHTLNTLGVPLSAGGSPSLQAQDVLQAVGNLDIMPSASGTGHSFTLGAAGNVRRTAPVSRGGLVFAMPSHSGESSVLNGSATLTHTNYFGFGVLSRTTLGVAVDESRTSPYLDLPEGIVRVASALPEGGTSVRTLSFGGSSLRANANDHTVQVSNQLSWFSLDNTHTIKVTSSLAHDGFTTEVDPQSTGSFAFNSLADLQSGLASSFMRSRSLNAQHGSQLVGSLSIGDYWRPVEGVQVQYGLRVDGNHFIARPPLNDALRATFSLPNNAVPNRAYVSPRVGLQWRYGRSQQIAIAPGAARPPQAVFHLGAGVFQNMSTSQLIAPAMRETGLPDAIQSLFCSGAAVPAPQWDAIPSACADGTAGSLFAAASPNVSLFDTRFRQPRSLRTAGDWSGPVLDNRFVLGVQGILSAGTAHQGLVDVNVVRTPRFNLTGEAGRPVYADVSAIVPATGAIAGGSGRVSSDFQHVWLHTSELETRSAQVSVNLKPVTANTRWRWDLTYALLDVHEQYSGFTSTSGDPFATEWGRSLQAPRHSVFLRWNDFPLFDLLYVTAAVQVSSGVRYTPRVASDENGDGSLNDRAFVPDTTTSTAMRAIFANGSSEVRTCLGQQLGRIAVRGSCQAPVTVANALQVKVNPMKVGLPTRANVAFNVINPLGIVDLLMHGSTDVRGWGQNTPPDENLLFVRGFDVATRAFRYDVNQRFGSTRPRETATHVLPYMSVTVSIDIGVPRERQLLSQHLDLGRAQPGNRDGPETLKSLGTSTIPNPMMLLLQQEGLLHLTRKQADSLANLSRLYSVFADSVWTPVASHLAALPDGFDSGDAYAQYVSARERTVDFLRTLVPHARAILTDAQLRQVPPRLAMYLDERVLRYLRSSTAGAMP